MTAFSWCPQQPPRPIAAVRMIAQAIKTRMEIPRPLFAAFPDTIIAFFPRESCDTWDTLWIEKEMPEEDVSGGQYKES